MNDGATDHTLYHLHQWQQSWPPDCVTTALCCSAPCWQLSDPTSLLENSIDSFQNGVVARGHITVQQPGVDHTCTIGGSGTGTTCTCKPAATCVQEATCFGSLCDYSKVSLAPSTAYKVHKQSCSCFAVMHPVLFADGCLSDSCVACGISNAGVGLTLRLAVLVQHPRVGHAGGPGASQR